MDRISFMNVQPTSPPHELSTGRFHSTFEDTPRSVLGGIAVVLFLRAAQTRAHTHSSRETGARPEAGQEQRLELSRDHHLQAVSPPESVFSFNIPCAPTHRTTQSSTQSMKMHMTFDLFEFHLQNRSVNVWPAVALRS